MLGEVRLRPAATSHAVATASIERFHIHRSRTRTDRLLTYSMHESMLHRSRPRTCMQTKETYYRFTAAYLYSELL